MLIILVHIYIPYHIVRYAVERYTFDYVFKVDDDTFINSELVFDFLYKYIKPKYNDINIGYYGGNSILLYIDSFPEGPAL